MRNLTLAAVLIGVTGLLLAAGVRVQEQLTRFEIRPSADYMQVVQEAPEDFTWERFARQVRLRISPGTEWREEDASRSIQLFAVGIRESEVVRRAASDPFEARGEQAVESVDFPEHVPAATEKWVPGERWVPVSHWAPDDDWIPGGEWAPWPDIPHIVRAAPGDFARAALEKGEGEQESRVLVVYATFADEQLRERAALRPFGLIFQRR